METRNREQNGRFTSLSFGDNPAILITPFWKWINRKRAIRKQMWAKYWIGGLRENNRIRYLLELREKKKLQRGWNDKRCSHIYGRDITIPITYFWQQINYQRRARKLNHVHYWFGNLKQRMLVRNAMIPKHKRYSIRNPKQLERERKRARAYFNTLTPERKIRYRLATYNRRKERLITDLRYAVRMRLTVSLGSALRKRHLRKSKTLAGYGIDIAAILAKIGACPGRGYELDHIIPCAAFDLSKPEEVKKCYSPNNLQWLTAHDNRTKSARIPNLI